MHQESLMRMLVSLVSIISLAALASTASAGSAPAQRSDGQPRDVRSRSRSAAPGQPAAPGASAAAPGATMVQLPPLDLSAVPEPCKPLTKQVMAPDPSIAFSARISLASCIAERAVAPLKLCDCGESIQSLDRAVAPALAILDDVIAAADPATQVIAEHAEGELHAGLVTRMLTTLPRVASDASEAEIALHDLRARTLDLQLAAWREAALASFQHVVELAKEHPALASNRVVASAVRDSQQRLAAAVAER
jgi:hypothetical protein